MLIMEPVVMGETEGQCAGREDTMPVVGTEAGGNIIPKGKGGQDLIIVGIVQPAEVGTYRHFRLIAGRRGIGCGTGAKVIIEEGIAGVSFAACRQRLQKIILAGGTEEGSEVMRAIGILIGQILLDQPSFGGKHLFGCGPAVGETGYECGR